MNEKDSTYSLEELNTNIYFYPWGKSVFIGGYFLAVQELLLGYSLHLLKVKYGDKSFQQNAVLHQNWSLLQKMKRNTCKLPYLSQHFIYHIALPLPVSEKNIGYERVLW